MPVARAADRWTAFLLSLCVPGLGQVRAGSGSCVLWLAAAAATAAVPDPWRAGLWLLLACASASHAKSCLSGRSSASHRVSVRLDGARVDLTTTVDLPCSRALAWAFVSDLPRFGAVDPFHDGVTVGDDGSLVLEHCAFGWPFVRVGRVLRWREGEGYAFSDLSVRGPRRGFPHVFFVSLESLGTTLTRLVIRVRGRWTARFLPAPLVRAWLRYVATEHGRLVAAAAPGPR